MAVTAFAKNIKNLDNEFNDGPVAASQTLYRRAIVMRDSSGNLKNGATASGHFGVGVAGFNDGTWLASTNSGSSAHNPDVWDNSGGGAGDIRARYDVGIWGPFANSGTSITAGMEGDVCYIVDNVTVHATSNNGARSPAGIIYRVDSTGVFVKFDEMTVRLAMVIGANSGVAFVQTYPTADATIANLTSATLTDNSGGAANTTVEAVAAINIGAVDPANPTEAEIEGAVNPVLAAIANNFADVVAQVNALRVDMTDNKQGLNSVIDALQSVGIVG